MPARDNACMGIAFRHYENVGTLDKSISGLNGWPTRTSVNISRHTSRQVAHDSRPAWIANPSPQKTFTSYPSPVFLTFTIR
jgi:hypothetical protein